MIRRFTVCILFTLMLTVFLSVGNYIISVIVGGTPAIDILAYSKATVQAAVGGMGLVMVAGALSDILRSHPAALILCGSFTLIGFMIRGSMVQPFDFLWFLECGFFTPLLRGQAIISWNGYLLFWSVWHISLVLLCLLLDIKKRKGRKAL
jgi:hypothetical protein